MSDTRSPVLLITGAAGSLGSALARQACAAGLQCILLDRDGPGLERLHDEIAGTGPAPVIQALDLAGAGPDDYENVAGALESGFGHLDFLVHAAADFTALRPLEHFPPEEWMQILQAGVTGPFLLTRAVLELLRSSPDGGRVVWLVDSPEARCGSYWGAYGVSQSARRALASILAAECRTRGPEVLLHDPGPFRSRLRSLAWPAENPSDLVDPEDAARVLLDRLVGH